MLLTDSGFYNLMPFNSFFYSALLLKRTEIILSLFVVVHSKCLLIDEDFIAIPALSISTITLDFEQGKM